MNLHHDLMEEYAKLMVNFFSALVSMGPGELFKYRDMAIDMPRIIGMLKNPDSSWYEPKFAVYKDYHKGD